MNKIALLIQLFNSIEKGTHWRFEMSATPTTNTVLYHCTIVQKNIGFTAEANDIKKCIETICTKAFHSNFLPFDRYTDFIAELYNY